MFMSPTFIAALADTVRVFTGNDLREIRARVIAPGSAYNSQRPHNAPSVSMHNDVISSGSQ